MSLIFKTLSLENFLSYREAKITLDGRGLILVTGEVIDSDMSNSNGAGKSALLPDSLLFALFGKTSRGLKGTDVINRNAEDCTVILSGETFGTPFTIERSVGKPVMPMLTIGDSTPISGVRDVNEAIQSLVLRGLSFDAFYYAFILDDRKFPHLDDSTKKLVLDNILSINVLSTAYKKAKQASEFVKYQLEELDTKKKYIEASLAAQRDVVASLSEDTSKSSNDLTIEKSQLTNKRRVLESSYDECILKKKAAEAQYNNYTNFAAAIRKKKEQIDAWNISFELDMADARKDLAKEEAILEGVRTLPTKRCPTCLQMVDIEHSKKIEKKYTERIIPKLRDTIARMIESKKEHAPRVKKIQEDLQKSEVKMASLKAEYEEASEQAQSIIVAMNRLEVDIDRTSNELSSLLKKEEIINTHKNKIEELDGQLIAMCKLIADRQTDLAYEEECVKAFSNSGVRSFLLDGALSYMNSRANVYGELLTGGELQILLDAQTETKSAGSKERISCTVYINGYATPYQACSKGQQRRADILSTLALGDLASMHAGYNINIRVLDEVFDSLDATGMERVMPVLNSLMQDKSSIFVMTHNNQFDSFFSSKVTVQLENGISSIL